MRTCRGFCDTGPCRIFDCGKAPAVEHFSLRIEPAGPEESSHPPVVDGIEPQTLRNQVTRASGSYLAIIAAEQLIAAEPDCVLLTLQQLYEEVRRRCTRFNERWFLNSGAVT
jgi:hypothetical protein